MYAFDLLRTFGKRLKCRKLSAYMELHCVEIRNCTDAFREPAIDTDRLGDVVPVCETLWTSAFLSDQRSNGNAPLLETPPEALPNS